MTSVDLEGIVRALAELDPVIEFMTDYDAGEMRCALCQGHEEHDPSCPWLRARILVGTLMFEDARRLAERTGGQVFAGGHAIYWPLDESEDERP